MTRGSECHIPEWAELMDASVPDAACDRQLRTFRDVYEGDSEGAFDPQEGS